MWPLEEASVRTLYLDGMPSCDKGVTDLHIGVLQLFFGKIKQFSILVLRVNGRVATISG